MSSIGRALTLALCSTLSNQQLLEKHLLNANALQMLSNRCSHMRAFAFIIYKIKENI